MVTEYVSTCDEPKSQTIKVKHQIFLRYWQVSTARNLKEYANTWVESEWQMINVEQQTILILKHICCIDNVDDYINGRNKHINQTNTATNSGDERVKNCCRATGIQEQMLTTYKRMLIKSLNIACME